MSVYLAACAIYRDEGPYLAEWLEFHRLVGVERFFLYDNFSEDDHRRVLQPYVRAGVVTVNDWPLFGDQQRRAYDHCLTEHREEARWIAFLDLDEFLFSPLHKPIPELLRAFEQSPGVCVMRREFTMSGHRTPPDGLVIESYLRALLSQPGRATPFKSIVDPARALRSINSHAFAYSDGVLAVDELGVPMQPPYRYRAAPLGRLRVNHYVTKSEVELKSKLATLDARGLPRPLTLPRNFDRWVDTESRDTLEDDAILPYAPALRAALERPQGAALDRYTN